MDENNDYSSKTKVRLTRCVELNFWKSCCLNALGLLLASATTSAIGFSNLFYFAALVVLIWFMNWLIKPVLVLFALPFIIFTMGFGMLFINAFIIYLSAQIIPDGIVVKSYWAAVWASFLVSVLWWSLELFKSERISVFRTKISGKKSGGDSDDNDDVIDV